MKVTKARAAMVLVAGVVALAGNAAAGPLAPYKYHKTAGVIDQEHPSSDTQLFVLYFDNLDPSGRTTHLNGSVGEIGSSNPFVAEATFFSYDPSQGHSLFTFTGVLDGTGLSLPISGVLNVTYDRIGRVHKVAVDGNINGTPFSVPPMVVTV
jgi:hypothetical protein